MTNFFTKEYLITLVTILAILGASTVDWEEAYLQIIAPHPHLPEAEGYEMSYTKVITEQDWEKQSTWGVYYIEKGHMKYSPVFVVGERVGEICGHIRSGGCLLMVNDQLSVIVRSTTEQTNVGCQTLTHEWFHLMGFGELEIPRCNPFDIDFRK